MKKNKSVILYSSSGAVVLMGLKVFVMMFGIGLILFGLIKLLAFVLEKLPHYKRKGEDGDSDGIS